MAVRLCEVVEYSGRAGSSTVPPRVVESEFEHRLDLWRWRPMVEFMEKAEVITTEEAGWLLESEGRYFPPNVARSMGVVLLNEAIRPGPMTINRKRKDRKYKVNRPDLYRTAGFLLYCLDGFRVW